MSRSRAVGSTFARMVCEFLAEAIPGVERRVDGGSRDRGDVAGLDADGWAVECKRTTRLEFAEAMKEAEKEAGHAKARWFVTVHWNRGKGVQNAFTTMPLWTFREVLVELRRLRREVEKLKGAA